MMKGGKDEKKMGPLFPRLHIHDTDRGGPKAPPRNKMGLYEQLSVPSQMDSAVPAPLLPLPPNNGSLLVPSSSSIQGGQPETTLFSSFHSPPSTAAYSSDKLHPSLEQKSMETANYPSLTDTLHFPSFFEYGSLDPEDLFNSMNYCGPKVGDGDDFMVPASFHSKITESSIKNPHSIDKERRTQSSPSQPSCTVTNNFSSSMQQNARKRTNTMDLTSRQHGDEENLKGSSSNKEIQKLASSSSTKENTSGPLKHTNDYDNVREMENIDSRLHQEYNAGFLVKDAACSHGVSVDLEKRNVSSGDRESCSRASLPSGHRHLNESEIDSNNCENVKAQRSLQVGDSCSKASHRNCRRRLNEAENGKKSCDNEKAQRSLQVGDVDRKDDSIQIGHGRLNEADNGRKNCDSEKVQSLQLGDSETSTVDCASRLKISPDDVVGAIGQKHFWKARRAIANQQRLFALQVFELHRLVKVQKLIAGSPRLLLEDDLFLSKPALKVSPPKKLLCKDVPKSPPQVKAKDESQKSKQGVESAGGTTPNDDLNKRPITQNSGYGPYYGNLPPPPVATDNKTGHPCCFQPPPRNQWLVPIMSPTEGLVYKPLAGAFPPSAGFMTPFYGGWGPMTVPSMAGGCLNPPYVFPGLSVLPGVPPAAQMYTPVMNTLNSASPFKEGSSLSRSRPNQ